MFADILQIEMLEAAETARMKENQDDDEFRITHTVRLVAMLFHNLFPPFLKQIFF